MAEEPRQAGAEIIVSEQMLEAGRRALANHYPGICEVDEDEEREALTEAFVSMLEIWQKS